DSLEGQLGFTHVQAGNVMSANIYGASVGGLVAVFLVRRFHWRGLLVALSGVLVVLEAASMVVDTYAGMLPLPGLDGLVGGVAVGIALSLLGRTQLPDRAFGALLVFQFLFGGLGSWALPEAVDAHGIWIVFACTTAMNVAALLVALLLRFEPSRAV